MDSCRSDLRDTIQIPIVERKIRFQILTFPGSIQICPAESAWLFGVSAIINSIPSNSTKTAWTLKESFSQAFNLFWKRAKRRIKPGQLFEQNPWTPTTLKKWQGVTGHLLTWSGYIRCFVSWLTKNMVPSIWWTKLNRSFAIWSFFWRSRRLLLEYQFENLTYWKDKQTFLISEHHGNFQRLNPGFLIDFSKTPKIWVIWGSRKEQANFFPRTVFSSPETKGSGEPGSKNQDPVHICLFLPKLFPQTNHPFWRHDISASGITIETSRLPGLGRKTPWLSYQQTGD